MITPLTIHKALVLDAITNFFYFYIFIPLFALIFTIPLVIILSSSIISAAILRYIIALYLQFKYGSEFGGMLVGSDAFLASDNSRAKSLVCAVQIIEFAGNFDAFYATVRKVLLEEVYNQRDKDPKPFAVKRTFLWLYHYYHNNQITLDDLIRIEKIENVDILDQDGLQNVLSQHYHRDLPKNDKALIEVMFVDKPMKWLNRNDGKQHYALLFRAHHSLLDGVAAMRIAVEKLSDSNTLIKDQYKFLTKDVEQLTCCDYVTKYYRKACKLSVIMLAFPTIMLMQLIKKEKDVNPLYGKKLSGEKILVWDVEPTRKYVNIVKETKNRLPNVGFADVVFTAFGESLYQYFKKIAKNKDDIPKYVTAFFPIYPRTKKLAKSNLYLNHFTPIRVRMPVSKCASSLIDKVNWASSEARRVESSILSAVTIFTIRTIFTYVPIPFVRLFSVYPVTLTFSSIPGMEALTMYGGHKLEDIMCFTQHRGKMGVSLVIVTYDGRFQLGLNIDKALISGEKDAKFILNNFWTSLERLHSAAHEKDYRQDPIFKEKYTVFIV